jgi:hypothetical protein
MKLRIPRISIFFCLLVALIISSCSTPQPAQEWFGMQVSSDVWQTEDLPDGLYQHGVLTHRTLDGCRAWIMSQDPAYAKGLNPNTTKYSSEEINTPETKINLLRAKDEDGNLLETYFEVYDITGRTGYDLYRLAYFLVETGDEPIQCLEAIHTLLITLKPELFPDLLVAQG